MLVLAFVAIMAQQPGLREGVRSGLALLVGNALGGLAALEPWTREHGVASARLVLNEIRDWVIRHPEDAVVALPEWQALRDMLRA